MKLIKNKDLLGNEISLILSYDELYSLNEILKMPSLKRYRRQLDDTSYEFLKELKQALKKACE